MITVTIMLNNDNGDDNGGDNYDDDNDNDVAFIYIAHFHTL